MTGIYVGHGRVIHLSGPIRGTGKFRSSSSFVSTPRWPCSQKACQGIFCGGIVITCVDCFLDGHSLYVIDYECSKVSSFLEKHDISVKSPDEVVDLAYAEFYRKINSDGYHLLNRNCEHFATYCKTGESFSMQSLWLKAEGLASRLFFLLLGTIRG